VRSGGIIVHIDEDLAQIASPDQWLRGCEYGCCRWETLIYTAHRLWRQPRYCTEKVRKSEGKGVNSAARIL